MGWDGVRAIAEAESHRRGVEGVVAKKLRSAYLPGKRPGSDLRLRQASWRGLRDDVRAGMSPPPHKRDAPGVAGACPAGIGCEYLAVSDPPMPEVYVSSRPRRPGGQRPAKTAGRRCQTVTSGR